MNKRGGYTPIFVVLVCFWTFLTFFSYYFQEDLAKTDISSLSPRNAQTEVFDGEYNSALEFLQVFVDHSFDLLDGIPVINVFVPLLRILTFQYGDFPPLVVVFLDLTFVLTGFIIARIVRGS